MHQKKIRGDKVDGQRERVFRLQQINMNSNPNPDAPTTDLIPSVFQSLLRYKELWHVLNNPSSLLFQVIIYIILYKHVIEWDYTGYIIIL